MIRSIKIASIIAMFCFTAGSLSAQNTSPQQPASHKECCKTEKKSATNQNGTTAKCDSKKGEQCCKDCKDCKNCKDCKDCKNCKNCKSCKAKCGQSSGSCCSQSENASCKADCKEKCATEHQACKCKKPCKKAK